MSQQSPLEQYFSSQTQGSFNSQATNLLALRPSQNNNSLYSNRLLSSSPSNGSKRNVAQLMDIFNSGKQKQSSQSGSQKDVLSPSSFFLSMTNPSNNIPFTPIIQQSTPDPNKQQSSQNASTSIPPLQNNLDNFLIKSKSSLSLSSTIDKEWLTLKFQNLEEKVATIQQKQNEMQEEVSSVMVNLIKKMESFESVLEKHQFMIEEQYSMLSDKIVEMTHDVSTNFADIKKASFDSSQSITKSVQECEHKIEEIKQHLHTLERTREIESTQVEKSDLLPPVKIPKIEKQSKTKSTSQKVLQNILDDKASQLLKPRKQEPIMLDDSWFCDEL